jgi:hypothetical protein
LRAHHAVSTLANDQLAHLVSDVHSNLSEKVLMIAEERIDLTYDYAAIHFMNDGLL